MEHIPGALNTSKRHILRLMAFSQARCGASVLAQARRG